MAFGVWRAVVAVLVLLSPQIALAADLPLVAPAPPPTAPASYTPAVPDWVVTIGGEVRAVPAWPGAPTSLYGITGFPLFNIRKPTDPPFFFGARDSFGLPLLDLGQFTAGPVFWVAFPRNSASYSQLSGLGNVGWTPEVGVYAQYWVVPWLRLRGELRQGFGGATGQIGDLYADVVVPVDKFRLSGGPRLTVQSTGAVSPYFSINAAQSAGSGLPVYNASGGFYSYGAGAQVEYFWNPQWQTHAIFEYERITGSAADSPLVTQRGSPNQFTLGVGATYTFNMRPLW